MGREARIFLYDKAVGLLSDQDKGYVFQYFEAFLSEPAAQAVSFTLPLHKESFISKTMFPFFDGLIPEGWLLGVAVGIWKLDPRDRMGLLLTCCGECIGAVSVMPVNEGWQ